MLGPYGVSMQVKWFSDWIQYGRQACVKVRARATKIQTCTRVDKGFFKYLLLESNQTFHNVMTLWGVNAHELVIRLDSIWPPGMRKSVSTSYKNTDLHTCRQRFFQVFLA